MANWHIYVHGERIAVGAVVQFTYTGGPVEKVSTDDTFSIEYPDNSRVRGKVIVRDDNSAVIEVAGDRRLWVIMRGKDESVWLVTKETNANEEKAEESK